MDLPVGLTGDVDVVEVAAVVFGVGSSQQQLTTGLGVRVPDNREDKNSNSVASDGNITINVTSVVLALQMDLVLHGDVFQRGSKTSP